MDGNRLVYTTTLVGTEGRLDDLVGILCERLNYYDGNPQIHLRRGNRARDRSELVYVYWTVKDPSVVEFDVYSVPDSTPKRKKDHRKEWMRTLGLLNVLLGQAGYTMKFVDNEEVRARFSSVVSEHGPRRDF